MEFPAGETKRDEDAVTVRCAVSSCARSHDRGSQTISVSDQPHDRHGYRSASSVLVGGRRRTAQVARSAIRNATIFSDLGQRGRDLLGAFVVDPASELFEDRGDRVLANTHDERESETRAVGGVQLVEAGGNRRGRGGQGRPRLLVLGFSVALSPQNILLCFTGCLVGTLIGVLPGVGPIATIAMLLPITYGVDPAGALIMLAGIYYGAQYGGSTSAILVNIPGEATAVITTLDGHQMARNGRAGAALGIAAIGSFIAGTIATLVVAAIGAPLTRLGMLFGAAEYFALMVTGLVFAVVLARGSVLKAIAMIVLGLLLSTVGTDVNTGQERLTFGIPALVDKIDFAVLAMGIFGFAELLRSLENPEARDIVKGSLGKVLPTWAELKQSLMPILRGTGLGTILGALPGNGAVLAPFASYAMEKKSPRSPRGLARGRLKVLPDLKLPTMQVPGGFHSPADAWIPPNAVMALMVGAMTIRGIVPGPQVMTRNPDLFWGMIASMSIGNLACWSSTCRWWGCG